MCPRRAFALLAMTSLFCLASGPAAHAADRESPPRELFRFLPGRIWASSGLPAAVAERAVEIDSGALLRGRMLLQVLDGRVFRLEPSGMDLRGPDDYALRGDLFDPEGEEPAGTATLTVKGRQIRGLISLPGVAYQIVPAEDGTHRLVEVDDSLLPPCATGMVEGDGSESRTSIQAPVQEPPGTALRSDAARRKPPPPSMFPILVFYTPQALQRVGSRERLEMLVQEDVDLTNTAFANSGVPLQIELKGVLEASYSDSGSLAEDLAWIRNGSLAARREWEVPTAVLIVGNMPACGVARLLQRDGFVDTTTSAQGSAVVNVTCLGSLTFAHELGHTLGCEHDPSNANPPAVALFPYGFGHFVDGSFRTVMSYPDDCERGCPRIPYFSNPALRFAGTPVGIPGQRDNSRVLQDTRGRFTGPLETECVPGPYTLCLREGRFKVQVQWAADWESTTALGKALPQTDTAGFFTFLDPAAPDVVVRTSDAANGVTLSYGNLTSSVFRLAVTDLRTGLSKPYLQGECGGRETGAFPADPARAAARRGKPPSCVAGPDAVCLHDRFQVRVEGLEGAAGATAVTRTTGAFDLGGDGEPELAVKIAPQGRRNFDVFYGTVTDREYTITITDTGTGVVKTYHNPAGTYCGGGEGQAF